LKRIKGKKPNAPNPMIPLQKIHQFKECKDSVSHNQSPLEQDSATVPGVQATNE